MKFPIDGEKLKSARWVKNGLFIRDLAKRSKVSERAIEEIERGQRRSVREATAKALARALKVDVRDLERKGNGIVSTAAPAGGAP